MQGSIAETKSTQSIRYREDLRRYFPWIVLILVFVIFSLLNRRFFSWYNMKLILMQTAIYAVVALGATFVILTGSIDLSTGSVIGLAAAIAVSVSHNFSAGLAILSAVLVGLVIGSLNGLVFVFGKIPSFITTLGMQQIARGLLLIYSQGNPVAVKNQGLLAIGSESFLGLPILAWAMLVMWALAYVVLEHTPFGRYVKATGAAERVTRITGVNVDRIKFLAFVVTGAAAGLGGALFAGRVGASTPTGGTGYELDIIVAIVLGGTSLSGGSGRASGTIIGALITGMLSNGLNIMGISPYTQMLVKGLVLVIATLVMIDRSVLSEIK